MPGFMPGIHVLGSLASDGVNDAPAPAAADVAIEVPT